MITNDSSILLFSGQNCSDSRAHGLQHTEAAPPSFIIAASLLKFISVGDDAIYLSHLLLLHPPSALSNSQHRVFPLSQLFTSRGPRRPDLF